MIQSAMLAEENKSASSLICASLLHDYGHFILDDPEELVNQKKDGRHEEIGYQYLKKYFVRDVVEPIKNHVKAKRYLARDKKYFKKNVVEPIKNHVKAKRYLARIQKYYQILSQASKVSLHLQGGVMNDEEAKEFEKEKFFDDSIKLRKFDEAAKKTDIEMKDINDYKSLLKSNLL